MFGFVVRRLLSSLLVILLASFAVFALFYLGPNNPAQPVCDSAGGSRCTPERLEAIEKSMGLDKPVVVAYGTFMKGIVAGREVTIGGGHAGGSAGPVHVGLGETAEAEIRVRWPGGDWSAWRATEVDRRVTIERHDSSRF